MNELAPLKSNQSPNDYLDPQKEIERIKKEIEEEERRKLRPLYPFHIENPYHEAPYEQIGDISMSGVQVVEGDSATGNSEGSGGGSAGES